MYIRLKPLRQTKRLYQSQLAEMLGTTQSVISRMELKGFAPLQEPHYKILCEAFGKDFVDEFCTEDPHMTIANNVNSGVGNQYNGYNTATIPWDIMQRQTEAIISIANKQIEQTDRMLRLLEKIQNTNEDNR